MQFLRSQELLLMFNCEVGRCCLPFMQKARQVLFQELAKDERVSVEGRDGLALVSWHLLGA